MEAEGQSDRHGGEARSYSSHMQEISFVADSSYLCIIKQGGASPEYMSDTAPLLATVNMLDKNRREFLKTKRVYNEKRQISTAHWREFSVFGLTVTALQDNTCIKKICAVSWSHRSIKRKPRNSARGGASFIPMNLLSAAWSQKVSTSLFVKLFCMNREIRFKLCGFCVDFPNVIGPKDQTLILK